MQKPEMHRHNELLEDTKYLEFIPDNILFKWFNDYYSTSKHVLTLYSIARGLQAKTILEIGFGRSSFVLARAASENKGKFITCDSRDFSYLLNNREKEVTTFINDLSNKVWEMKFPNGIDFAFLDYYSSEKITEDFVKSEILKCIPLMKKNGIIAIHDTIIQKYKLSDVIKSLKIQNKFSFQQKFEIISLPYNYGLGIIRVIKNSKHGEISDNWLKK